MDDAMRVYELEIEVKSQLARTLGAKPALLMVDELLARTRGEEWPGAEPANG